MNPYTYSISLRISHPTIAPENITKILKMSPTRAWLSGDRRTTPKGKLLEGYCKESYWSAPTHDEKRLYSKDIKLEKYLEEFTKNIQMHSDFFHEIKTTSGKVEYFAGLYIAENSGIEIPSSILLFLGKLGIDLALDICPEDKEQ